MMEELNREIGKLNNEWYYKNRDLYKNLTDDCVAPEPKYVKFHTYGLRMKGAMKHWGGSGSFRRRRDLTCCAWLTSRE